MEELMNLDNLSEEEKKQILLVIKRDEELKKAQDTRMGQLKAELHNLRMQSVLREGDDLNKICARCHKPFGFFFNTGDVCSQCKFRVCSSCRESLLSGKWLCVLCYKQIQLKGISGDWIYGGTDNENHRKSFSGAELVKKSLRKSLSANGRVADDYSDPGTESFTKQKDYGTESQSGRDFIHSTSDEYSKDFQQEQNSGNLTSKPREADGSNGGPDSKRGLVKHNSASHEELDRVEYPKDSDKKRLSSLFDSFKSSKDETEEQIQVRHVSCRRRRDSDSESDSGSSLEGESPMEIGDSKTQSSDHLSSAHSASLAQNLSETESTSDMLREKRLSAEISIEAQVPSEDNDQNGGQSSEEMSRQSPEVVPMMPTETVITIKRRSGEPEYLPTLEESVECPVSPARNTSQMSEHRSNIVRRTSSEKSDSSMSSARTASPATKMRLLDLASKRALERESFDHEESGNESPKHKDDSLTNGLSQPKRTPINGSSARHELGEGFGVFKAVEESSCTPGEGRHGTLAGDPLGPSLDPPSPQSVHAHKLAFHSLDTEQEGITPTETLYTERGNLGFGDDNMPAFPVTDNYSRNVMHDTSQHEPITQTNTGEGHLLRFCSDVDNDDDNSVDNQFVENQFVASDSLGADRCHSCNVDSVTTLTDTDGNPATAAAAASAAADVSPNIVPLSNIYSVTQFQSSPVVSYSEVNVAFSTPEPSNTQIAFNVIPLVENASECSKIKHTEAMFKESLSDPEQRRSNDQYTDLIDCQTQCPDDKIESSNLLSQENEANIGSEEQNEHLNTLSKKGKTSFSKPLSQIETVSQDRQNERQTVPARPLSQSSENGSIRYFRPMSQGSETGSERDVRSVRPMSQDSETGSERDVRFVRPMSQGSETGSERDVRSVRPMSQDSETVSERDVRFVRPMSQGSKTGSERDVRSVRPMSQGSKTGSERDVRSVRPMSQGSETGSERDVRSVRPMSQGSKTGSERDVRSVRPLSQGTKTGSERDVRSVRPLSQGSETGLTRPISQSSGTGSFSSGYDVDIGVSELVLHDVNPRLAMMVRREQLLSCSDSSLDDDWTPDQEKINETTAAVEPDTFGDEIPLVDLSDRGVLEKHFQGELCSEETVTATSVVSDPFHNESLLLDLSANKSLLRRVKEGDGSEETATATDVVSETLDDGSMLVDLYDNDGLQRHVQETICPEQTVADIVYDPFGDESPMDDFSVHDSLQSHFQTVVVEVHQSSGTLDVPDSDSIFCQDVEKADLARNVQLIDLTDTSKDKILPDESVDGVDVLMMKESLYSLSQIKATRSARPDAEPVSSITVLDNEDVSLVSKSSEEVSNPVGGSPNQEEMILGIGTETHQTENLSGLIGLESAKQGSSSLLQNIDSKTTMPKDEIIVNIETKDQDRLCTRTETGKSKIQGLLAFWKEKQTSVSEVESRKQTKEHDKKSKQQSCSRAFQAPIVSEAANTFPIEEGINEFEDMTVDNTKVTAKDDYVSCDKQVIAEDLNQTITKDSCFSTTSTCTTCSPALSDTFTHLAPVSGNLSDSDITISDLTNSSKYSDASDPSISPLSSDTDSSVLAVDSNPQYACSSSDQVTSAREIELDVKPNRESMQVSLDNITSARDLELDTLQPRDSIQVTSEVNIKQLGVAPRSKKSARVAVEPPEHVSTEPASASANSPQPETCSESEVDDFEVEEFPLYASPEEVQELQSSADEGVDSVLDVKLQQIRDLPVQADAKVAGRKIHADDTVDNHQTQEEKVNSALNQAQEKVIQQKENDTDNDIRDIFVKNEDEISTSVQDTDTVPILRKERGRKRNRHEEVSFENEDILETKSEPSTVHHNLMDDAPERTSTPKNRIETIDDDTLFKLLSSVPLSTTTLEGLEPPKRRGSKDDSEIQLKSTSQSSTTAASSAATMVNLSQIGMPVSNDEGDPFATESADVREAMQRYLDQEEEMSDCLSVITERTEPEDDDYDDVSEISKGLDETVEDDELDKEIEKIYQANLHIDSYLSSESFSSGTVSAAIKKSRKGLQKKHIAEVLSSPISHDLPAITESEPESTETQDKGNTEGQEGESHEKLSTVSDTISAYLSDMSSVDNSNLQTPASSEPVSDEDDKSDPAATASDEQDSAWFDMSMSMDSVKEVLTPRGSVLQKENLKASLSSETLCDEDLPRDDEDEVDSNTNQNGESQREVDGHKLESQEHDGIIVDMQTEQEMSGNQMIKNQSGNQNDIKVQNQDIENINEQDHGLESGNASTQSSVSKHVADEVTVTSDTILSSSSLVTSLPDLDPQAQSTTLTSTFAASPASPTESSSDIRPQVKVTGDVMSDETGSHGGDSGHISGNSAENTPEHRGSRSPRHSHLSIPSLALTSTSAEEASQEEDEDIDEMVATHKSVGSLRGSYGNLTSSLADSRESLYSVYSDAGEINYGKIPVSGEILFGLDYNYKTGALEIYIKQCKDIAPVDTKRNKSDPYVKTYLLPDRTRSGKRKTKIKKHTLNPTFDEVLKYVISKSEVENRALWVTVWHHDRFGRNDFLGEVMIGLDCYKFGDSTPIWYPLQERLEAPGSAPVSYKGDLVLSVKYVPAENIESKETTKKGKSKKVKGVSRGELQVLIKEARNLTAVRSNGASDPFCKAYLLPEKHKSSKQKTPVIKRNCNPTWNHVFLFEDIDVTELKDRSLELTVWDYDKITSNDFLGGIRLNLGTGVAGGRNAEWMDGRGEEIALWQSVMDRPNCWNDATIGLRASMGKSEIRK